MPQIILQYKLFEYDIRDQAIKSDSEDYVPGKDNKNFVVQMYGIDTRGKTACIFVRGFDPFFYVKVASDWNKADVADFCEVIKKGMGSYYEESLIKARIVERQRLYGFDNQKLHKFIQFKFKNTAAMNKAKNLWYLDTNINGVFNRRLRDTSIGSKEAVQFKNTITELYEAQIPPLLRLFHIQEISPSGWVKLRHGTYMQHKKQTTTCDYEYTINYKQLKPIPKKKQEFRIKF